MIRMVHLIWLAAAMLLAASLQAQSQRIVERTRDLPTPRQYHGAAVMGDYLYVLGGSNASTGAPDTSVVMAPLDAAGKVSGEWRTTTPLPGPRYYINNSTLVLNDVVYVFGGARAALGSDTSLNTAVWSRPLPNGHLTPWQESEPFGEGLIAASAVSTPGFIHVLGGKNNRNQISTQVWSNPVYADGSLSRWEPGPQLPVPLWFHHSGVAAGRVWVWGGMHNDDRPIRSTRLIISAPILGSGRLGPWRREHAVLPESIYAGSSAVAGHYLLTFSPKYDGGVESNDIWWTYVGPAGMVPWTKRETDVPMRIYHAVAPDYRRGTIYIPGGRPQRTVRNPLNEVHYFGLSPAAREQAERTWSAAQAAHSNTVAAFTAAMAEPGSGEADASRRLTYIADRELAEDAIPGFRTISDARREATRQGRPLVLYFNLPDVGPCREQRELLATTEFGRLMELASFAWIDSSEYPQLTQQLGIYRVPTWIFYDVEGNERGRRVGVMHAKEIGEGLLSIRQ